MIMSRFQTIIIPLIDLIRDAGRAILSDYTPDVAVATKADGSPVTHADRAAEQIILAGLRALSPGTPIVSEEATAADGPPDIIGPRFWLVDPLDGTAEFISHSDEFTVNIALIEDGKPVLGIVHAPVSGDIYMATGLGTALYYPLHGNPAPLTARRPAAAGLTVLVSRRHGDKAQLKSFLAGQPVQERITQGSSLKFCTLAAGRADLYPRFGPTMEWDTAAGQAVLEGAGGRVLTEYGKPLAYAKPGFANPSFIARGQA